MKDTEILNTNTVLESALAKNKVLRKSAMHNLPETQLKAETWFIG